MDERDFSNPPGEQQDHRRAIERHVTLLLNGYPASGGISMETIAVYVMIASRQPATLVERVVFKFLSGKVPRKSRDFAPSVELFGKALEDERMSDPEIVERCRLNGWPIPERLGGPPSTSKEVRKLTGGRQVLLITGGGEG